MPTDNEIKDGLRVERLARLLYLVLDEYRDNPMRKRETHFLMDEIRSRLERAGKLGSGEKSGDLYYCL